MKYLLTIALLAIATPVFSQTIIIEETCIVSVPVTKTRIEMRPVQVQEMSYEYHQQVRQRVYVPLMQPTAGWPIDPACLAEAVAATRQCIAEGGRPFGCAITVGVITYLNCPTTTAFGRQPSRGELRRAIIAETRRQEAAEARQMNHQVNQRRPLQRVFKVVAPRWANARQMRSGSHGMH